MGLDPTTQVCHASGQSQETRDRQTTDRTVDNETHQLLGAGVCQRYTRNANGSIRYKGEKVVVDNPVSQELRARHDTGTPNTHKLQLVPEIVT